MIRLLTFFRHWSNKNIVLNFVYLLRQKRVSYFSQRVFNLTALPLPSFSYPSWSTSYNPSCFPASVILSRQYLHNKSQLKEKNLKKTEKSVANMFHWFFVTKIQSNYPSLCLSCLTIHFERCPLWRVLCSMLPSGQLVARLQSVCTLLHPQTRAESAEKAFLSVSVFSRSCHVSVLTSCWMPSSPLLLFPVQEYQFWLTHQQLMSGVRILQSKKLWKQQKKEFPGSN